MEPIGTKDITFEEAGGTSKPGRKTTIQDSTIRIVSALILAVVFVIVAGLTSNDGFRTALIGFIGACVGFIVGTVAPAADKKK